MFCNIQKEFFQFDTDHYCKFRRNFRLKTKFIQKTCVRNLDPAMKRTQFSMKTSVVKGQILWFT